jgi:hypothetical protein
MYFPFSPSSPALAENFTPAGTQYMCPCVESGERLLFDRQVTRTYGVVRRTSSLID